MTQFFSRLQETKPPRVRAQEGGLLGQCLNLSTQSVHFSYQASGYFQHRGPLAAMGSPLDSVTPRRARTSPVAAESSHTPLKQLWVGSVLGIYWISPPFLEALCGLGRVALPSCAFYFLHCKVEGHSPCLLMGYHKAYQTQAHKRLWTFQRRE